MVISTVLEDAREEEWQMPVSMAEADMETDTESDLDASPPVHPVPTMQGAFEESMKETMNDDEPEVPDRYSKADSVTRRKMLLEQQEYERTVAGRWKQKTGEKFHPLWKLVAQISFGMHLLQQGLAKSDEEVLKILQTHVDEVDGFLERTTEDFDLAQKDIDERIRYLKLPLDHGQVFDSMLSNRDFRVAIVEGNEKIEHIIDRTAAAMTDALKDVQKGLDATRELAKYMTRVDKQWEDRTEDHDAVYLAMIGNTEGWTRAFLTLQSKGGHLRKALCQLGTIVAEMQRRAGAASRKNLVPSRSANGNRYQVDTRFHSPRVTPTPPRSPMKNLPTAPESVARVAYSQKYVKASITRSPTPSPRMIQQNMEHGSSARKLDPRQQASPVPSTSPSSPLPAEIGKDKKPSLTTKLSQSFRPVKNTEQAQSPNSPDHEKSKFGTVFSRSIKSPEPGRKMRYQDSGKAVKVPDATRSEKYQHQNGYANGVDSGRITHSASPVPSDYNVQRSRPPQDRRQNSNRVQFKTSEEATTQNLTVPGTSTSEQVLSRRRSLTERTRDLLRKKPSFAKETREDSISSASLPIQSPSSEHAPVEQPSSPGRTTIVRRASSRNANAMSMSAYSQSPTSPTKSPDEAPIREASPVYIRNGKPVPPQASYATLSLLPVQPLSPLQHPAMSLAAAEHRESDSPVENETAPARIMKNEGIPVNSEGNADDGHPLLQTARHTRFARNANGDLPLRHYHSQGAFTHSNPDLRHQAADNQRPPKRSSSLLYNPNTSHKTTSESDGMRSPTLDQTTQIKKLSPKLEESESNPPEINSSTRINAGATESKLGVHPAHRVPESAAASDVAASPSVVSSPSPASFATAQGATPPPISTGRSPEDDKATPRAKSPIHTPPSRIAPFAPSSPQKQAQATINPANSHDWHPQHASQPSNDSACDPNASATTKPAYKTSATNNAPFYLNPASSTALIDFLKSTPPPSPPHPGTRVECNSPSLMGSPNAFNRAFITSPYPQDGDVAASSPPAPGSRSMTHLGRSTTGEKDRERDRKGWRKMFGSGKSTKKKGGTVNGREKRFGNGIQAGELSDVSGMMREKVPDGFVGLGTDGNWISRKNFVKT